MSEYTRNAVYTRIVEAIQAQAPGAYCTSRYVAKPPSFPSCYIHEIDNFRPPQFVQLDFEDKQWESVFEVQVTSTKANIAASEANSIMGTVVAAFNELYYRKFSEASIDEGNKYTVIGRFRRRIGGGDQMPA